MAGFADLYNNDFSPEDEEWLRRLMEQRQRIQPQLPRTSGFGRLRNAPVTPTQGPSSMLIPSSLYQGEGGFSLRNPAVVKRLMEIARLVGG